MEPIPIALNVEINWFSAPGTLLKYKASTGVNANTAVLTVELFDSVELASITEN